MVKWEYKTVLWDSYIDNKESYELNEYLNELGDEGWELVSTSTQIESSSNTDDQLNYVGTNSLILILKRIKE